MRKIITVKALHVMRIMNALLDVILTKNYSMLIIVFLSTKLRTTMCCFVNYDLKLKKSIL